MNNNLSKILNWLDVDQKTLSVGSINNDTATTTNANASDDAPCPWAKIEQNIPDGFKITANATYIEKITRKGEIAYQKICGPIAVLAGTHDFDGQNYGLKAVFINKSGIEHIEYVGLPRLYEQGGVLISELSDRGFMAIPGLQSNILRMLAEFKITDEENCVKNLGWTTQGDFAFVDHVITRNGNERCVYQPERNSATTNTIHSKGSLSDWKIKVAKPVAENPIPAFGIMWGLASPLLPLVGMDSAAIHNYGITSEGKTTTLQIATSTFGCGADPSASPKLTAIRTWNSTANGLEGTCAAYNNLMLPLDEIGKCTANDVGAVAYNIFGGQGKASLKSDRTIREARSWTLHGYSTGEKSAREKIEEKAEAKGGQLIRVLDIPVPPAGLFPNTGNLTPKQFADQMKKDCSKNYGTAMPAFIEGLLKTTVNHEKLCELVTTAMHSRYDDLVASRNLTEAQQRVATRFGLVQAAGEFAVDLDILPFSKRQVTDSVNYVFNLWLEDNSNVSDKARGVARIRDFIMGNLNRFYVITLLPSSTIPNRMIGYHKNYAVGDSSLFEGEFYLFNESGFREACVGFDLKMVCRTLHEHDYLVRDKDQFKTRHTVPTISGESKTRFYAIKAEILKHDEETIDDTYKPGVQEGMIDFMDFV